MRLLRKETSKLESHNIISCIALSKCVASLTTIDLNRTCKDEKAMIKKRYNRIPHPAQDAKLERNTNSEGGINCISKAAQQENKEDSSFLSLQSDRFIYLLHS